MCLCFLFSCLLFVCVLFAVIFLAFVSPAGLLCSCVCVLFVSSCAVLFLLHSSPLQGFCVLVCCRVFFVWVLGGCLLLSVLVCFLCLCSMFSVCVCHPARQGRCGTQVWNLFRVPMSVCPDREPWWAKICSPEGPL